MNHRLPLLRGQVHRSDPFQSVFGSKSDPLPRPARDPDTHRANLFQQIDRIAQEVAARPAGTRIQGASRELVSVRPEPGFELVAESLADARSDARLVAVDDETGAAIVDTPKAELTYLRKKIEDFADDTKISKITGSRRNEPAVAPIREFALANDYDLAGTRLRGAALTSAAVRWFEIACRGGYESPEDSTESRNQIGLACQRFNVPAPQEYEATDRIVFFSRMSLATLRQLVEAVDCIYEFDVAGPATRAFLTYEAQLEAEIYSAQVVPPPNDAPSVVLLDTGVSTDHPLLEPLIRGATCVVPGFELSPEDTHGHGTEMAGTAAFSDVVQLLDDGSIVASHWIESARIMIAPGVATATEEYRPFWPKMTVDAVRSIEDGDERLRVFATAIAAQLDHPGLPTYWSHAVDSIAYNRGKGRLFIVCIGNASSEDITVLTGYPTMNLEEKLHDPAQAINAVTVGAFTRRVELPPGDDFSSYVPVAPRNGVSPHTSAGLVRGGDAIKPDIVFEGGNVGLDDVLPNPTIPSMVGVTTGHRHKFARPLSIHWATSEATARAANFAGRLWAMLPSLRAETVRALLVHSAAWTQTMKRQFPNLDERLAICGFGEPNLEFATACTNARATVIVENELANAQVERVKQSSTKKPVEKFSRELKLFEMPLPEHLLLDAGDSEIELRVTLSYFSEPNTFRRRLQRGLDLRWDMQGPQESEQQFLQRINKLARGGKPRKDKTKGFGWSLGIQRRSRGTVQRDSWIGPASLLAGSKQIAVYPSLGWWDRSRHTKLRSLRFSLIVSVIGPGLDLYTPIATALEATIPFEV